MDPDCHDTFWTLLTYLEMWQRFTYVGLCSIITAGTLLSNIAVIFSIFYTGQQNKIFCRLVLFLSLSDCFLAISTQTSVSIIILKPRFDCVFKLTSQFSITLFQYLSSFIILATAFERLINVKNINETRQNVATKRTSLILLICVGISLLFSTSFTVATVYDMYMSLQFVHQMALLTGIASVLLLYTILYRRVVLHVIETTNLQSTGLGNPGRENTQHRPTYLLSTARVIKRILTALCITGMPYAIFQLYMTFGTNTKQLKHVTWMSFGYWFTAVLLYLNSTMNAVIFILGNQKSKRFLKYTCERRILMNQDGP